MQTRAFPACRQAASGREAALYEVALDLLATRTWEDRRVRPKIVASTATVRRAIQARNTIANQQPLLWLSDDHLHR